MTDGPVLTEARWTHVALPTGDLERSIEFYTSITPLVEVERFSDDDGRSVWLSNPGQSDSPVRAGARGVRGGQGHARRGC